MVKSNFSIQPLLDKGYVLDEKTGTLTPPKLESPFMKQQKALNEGLVVREKVVETPNFTARINTEWWIKGSIPSKKNSRQNFSNGISIPSKKHAEYAKATEMQYTVFGIEFRRAVKFYGLEYPLKIEFTFVRATKHSFDYCNICQTCEDLMKDQYKKKKLIREGWFPDDSANYIKPSFGDYEYDKNNAGVRIKLITK